MSQRKTTERFPLTLGVLGFYLVALIIEPLFGLSAATFPVLAAYGSVLLGMTLAGVSLLLILSVIFTGGFALVKADKPFKTYTRNQGLIVAGGFAGVSVLQLYVNQAVLSTVLSPVRLAAIAVTPDPTTAFALKIVSAISEEALFCAVTAAGYLTFRYFGAGRILAAAPTLVGVAYGFVTFHQYVLQAIQDTAGALAAHQAWYFFFGARLILSGVLLGTLWYSEHTSKTHYAASLAAPLIIHVGWNLVS